MAATLLRYWAAAREAAGTAEDEVSAGTLGEALAEALDRTEGRSGADGARLARLFGLCSYLVDGDPVGRRDPGTVRLRPGAVVEVLPPFAGG